MLQWLTLWTATWAPFLAYLFPFWNIKLAQLAINVHSSYASLNVQLPITKWLWQWRNPNKCLLSYTVSYNLSLVFSLYLFTFWKTKCFNLASKSLFLLCTTGCTENSPNYCDSENTLKTLKLLKHYKFKDPDSVINTQCMPKQQIVFYSFALNETKLFIYTNQKIMNYAKV